MILSADHTTVAISEDQVYNLIRVACNETAHASFEMMNGLLQRASRLPSGDNASTSHTKPLRMGQARAATPLSSSMETPEDSDDWPASSVAKSYTGGAIRRGDNDMSLPSLFDAEGQLVEQFGTTEDSRSSQEQVTLASLRHEALNESPRVKGGKRSTRTVG